VADFFAYGGLFLSALVAATILPMQSEGVLVALLVAGEQAPGLLVLVASIGNVLGAVIYWMIGRSLDKLRVRFRIGPAPRSLARARIWYERWGRWTLLLSWAPFIGDPLTIVAGVHR